MNFSNGIHVTAIHFVSYRGNHPFCRICKRNTLDILNCLDILLSTAEIDINLQMQEVDLNHPPLDDDYYASVSALSLAIFHFNTAATKKLLAHPLIQV